MLASQPQHIFFFKTLELPLFCAIEAARALEPGDTAPKGFQRPIVAAFARPPDGGLSPLFFRLSLSLSATLSFFL